MADKKPKPDYQGGFRVPATSKPDYAPRDTYSVTDKEGTTFPSKMPVPSKGKGGFSILSELKKNQSTPRAANTVKTPAQAKVQALRKRAV